MPPRRPTHLQGPAQKVPVAKGRVEGGLRLHRAPQATLPRRLERHSPRLQPPLHHPRLPSRQNRAHRPGVNLYIER